jgi:DNA-binding IclR family transcriptional regulator
LKKHIIPNLLKAAEVLRQVVAHDEGLSQAEIQRIVHLPKATAFRILNSWITEGFVRKVGKRYFAGIALAQAGLKSLKGLELRDKARPVLAKLAHISGETAHLAVESGAHALILEVADSPNPIRAANRAGALADIHCSSTGKVFLAAKSNDEIEEVLERVILDPRTRKTHTSKESLMQDLETIRTNGYAVDDEEYYLGVRCLAAPVYDATGQLIAAIGITGTADRFTADRNHEISQYAKDAARELERKIATLFEE